MKPYESRMLEHNIYFFCHHDCEHLNITERDQNNKKIQHMCEKYNICVLHENFHPYLIRPRICINDRFEEIEIAALKKDLVELND